MLALLPKGMVGTTVTNARGFRPTFDNDGAAAIRVAYDTGEATVYEIADKFGVSTSTILNLLRGETYKKAGGPIKPNLKIGDKSKPVFSVEDVNVMLDSLGDGLHGADVVE